MTLMKSVSLLTERDGPTLLSDVGRKNDVTWPSRTRIHRHETVAAFVKAPRSRGPRAGIVDVDARRAPYFPRRSVEQEQLVAREIASVVVARDAQRLAQFAGPVGEKARIGGKVATCGHDIQAEDRLERTNQHGVRLAFARDHDIEGPTDSVKQIDVRAPRWTEHRFGSFGASARAVRRLIERAAVGLALDDATADESLWRSTHQDFSDAVACDDQHRACIERGGEFTLGAHLWFAA